ncbi:MAG TPA: hypothetical protein VGX03_08570 [Candidatus Binatia bacterium]|nr:hypothetical protein [Candidatus Binatia bacterium]
MWSPPIAGIPYEQVLEIHRRHVEELGKLPGVESAGLGADGIHVWTSNPDIVPKEVEGVPVIIHPATGMPGKTLNHTYNTFVRPLHGAVSITETTQAGSYGTLTGVTLSDGKPWIIFPAHLLGTCDDPPPCNSTLLLNRCDHYDTGTQPLLLQPVTGGLSGRIGYAQRWTPISSSFYSPDIAAAFMDSDVQENNGFLAANRKVHDDGSDGIAFLGTPVPELPPVGLTVLMRSSIGPPHALQLQVQQVNTVANNVITGCRGGAYSFFNSQIRYSVLGGYTLSPGDSGSPVFDLAGRLVGMLNACLLLYTPETGYYCDPNYIYGTDIITTKNNLKFDAWYGTQTVYDQTIGIFRPSTQQWILDNGNNKLDACGTDLRYYDTCLGPFGQPGDTPVTGRWNSTVRKIGVFRSGSWYLDFSGNGLWGTGDVQYGPLLPYQASDLPVVGSWGNPNNGYSKIGIFRNGTWYVDYNGNGVWDGCTTDRCWTFMAYQAGDKPVVIGRVDSYGEKIGVFRNGT